jgi:hypothetical protein
MKTINNRSTQIKRVSVGVKATRADGSTRNVVLVELANAPMIKDRNDKSVKACVIFSEQQFAVMCAKAGVSPRLASQLLVGSTLVGQYEFQHAGTEYTATEKSAAVIAGEANVGETLKREQSGYQIENGTLPEFQLGQRNLQLLINADAYAQAAISAETTANAAQAEVEVEIDEVEETPDLGAKLPKAKTAKASK